MTKLKSQKITFKGLDSEGIEVFSWLGEENHYNENGAITSHKKFNENGEVFEEGETSYRGDLVIKDVYQCTDEGTSTSSFYTYDEQGRDLETRIDYEGYSEIQKFAHKDGFTEIIMEDEEGELENRQLIWYDREKRIVKTEVFNERNELEQKQERTYTDSGKELSVKTFEGESDQWTEQSYSYDDHGNQIGSRYKNDTGLDEKVFDRTFDSQDRVVKLVQDGQQQVEFEYEGENYMSQSIFNIAQIKQLAAHTEFYTENKQPVKTVSTHNIRSYAVDSNAVLKSGVASYEYHFENEYYDGDVK
jgi:hypothetical protein